jgi:alpha-mannosidase
MSWGIPTVLSAADIKYLFAGLPTYFTWKRMKVPSFWDESTIFRRGRPDAFRWEGPDGSSVLVYYQGGYGFLGGTSRGISRGPNSLNEILSVLPRQLEAIEKQGSPFSVLRGTHMGLDNLAPNLNISHVVREWNNKWAYPKLVVATQTMFFEALEKQCDDIQVFRGELPDTDFGVGAISTAKETGINRVTHDQLHAAEKFNTIASVIGDYQYPAKTINEAYDNVLLYDEHTWGAANPIGKIYDWDWSCRSNYAYQAAGLSERLLTRSLDGIVTHIKREGHHNIIVFNPLSYERTDIVRLSPFGIYKPFDLIDNESGQKVPYQIIELNNPQAPVPHSAARYAVGQFNRPVLSELVFAAKDVPSLGYKSYKIIERDKTNNITSSVVVGDTSLENSFFKITLDPKTGTVNSIYDKQLSKELVDVNAPHGMNQFIARWAKSGRQESSRNVHIRKGQTGPVCGSLIVSSEGIGCPQITQEITIYDQIKRIDFANRLLKDSTPYLEIYFAFPFKIDNPDFRFEGSNCVIEPFKDQFPGSNTNYYTVQHWADVSDGHVGVTLSSNESYIMEFGGLWPCYVSQAHHGVTPFDFGRDFVKADQINKGYMYSFVMDNNFRTNFAPVQQGDMLFRYSITTHKGDWKQGRCRDFGWSTGNPLIPVYARGKNDGPMAQKMSFCQVDKSNVFVLTLKRAEDGDGIIIRLIETEGQEVTAKLRLPHINIKKAYQANVIEKNKGELPFADHNISVPLKAFGISTIRIRDN